MASFTSIINEIKPTVLSSLPDIRDNLGRSTSMVFAIISAYLGKGSNKWDSSELFYRIKMISTDVFPVIFSFPDGYKPNNYVSSLGESFFYGFISSKITSGNMEYSDDGDISLVSSSTSKDDWKLYTFNIPDTPTFSNSTNAWTNTECKYNNEKFYIGVHSGYNMVSDRTQYIDVESACITNVPIFRYDDYESMYKYLKSGERPIVIPPIDYTLYIDGDRLPNYNLNWNPNSLGEYGEHSQVIIEFRAVASNPLLQAVGSFYDKTDYTNGFFKFNWSDVWQKLDAKIAIIDDFLTNEFTIFIHSSTNINGENIKPHTSVGVNLLEKKNVNGDLYRELVSPSSTGDTLTIDFGDGKDSDDNYDSNSGENDEHSHTIGYDIGTSNLTVCFELSVERLNNIASKLWSSDFFDNILLLNNSPIENILSCKLLPLSLSGIESSVKIGNVDMGINGNRLNSTVVRYNVGNISIPRVANMGFLNYAPYTTITIFLPFIGFKELNTSDVMGRNISVDYIVDVITGACKCCINVNNYQCYEYDGNCGIDIPLTSSNRSQVEMGYVQSALGVVTNIGSGNYGGAIGEAISGAVQQYHYNSNGSYSPSTGAYEDRTCFIIIDRPQYSEVSNFGHTKGYKCQLTKTIKNLNGFFKTTNNVDLSNISAPKFCKDKMLELLSSGAYV